MLGTNNKLLVVCPTCQMLGKKNILGELKDGCLIIMRFHNNFTRIRGEFEVVCESCSEPVYFRTERRGSEYEMLNHGVFGLLGSTSLSEAGTARA